MKTKTYFKGVAFPIFSFIVLPLSLFILGIHFGGTFVLKKYCNYNNGYLLQDGDYYYCREGDKIQKIDFMHPSDK